MSWTKSLADEPDMVAELRVSPHLDIHRTTTVHAPCCGARVAADMVMDLRGMAQAVLATGPIRGDLDWACDACLTRLFREDGNPWTRAKFMQAHGAPAADVRRERAKERAYEKKLEAYGRGEAVRWDELLEDAWQKIPEEPDLPLPD